MSKSNYFLMVLTICFMLPVAAVAPYIFYGTGFRVLRWVWMSGYWPFWVNLSLAILSGVICFILLLQFNSLGRLFYSLFSIIITANSAFFAMTEHRHSLLVIVFTVAAMLVWTGEWIRKVLDLPFYNSRRHWWESHPKSVPGIHARVFQNEQSKDFQEARVVNFGEEGCFVFLTDKKWPFKPGYVELSFNDNQQKQKLNTAVTPVLFTSDRKGVGLKFDHLAKKDDWNHDLQEYLNGLRRSGYVSG